MPLPISRGTVQTRSLPSKRVPSGCHESGRPEEYGAPDGTGAATAGENQKLPLRAADAEERGRGACLGQQIKAGAAWTAGTTMLMGIANIGIMAIVARLVSPYDFGVFGLAVAAFAFLVTLSELGVSAAIARSDLDLDEIAPTVATIAIVTSLILAGFLSGFAGPISNALGNAAVAAPLRVLSICIVLNGVFAVPNWQLHREFKQRRVFLAHVIAFFPTNAMLIVMALQADGALAFAWSRVVGQIAMGLVVLFSVSRRYWPGLRKSWLAPLLRFGLPLALANLLSQVLLNVDYVFVGRMLGTETTGVYVLAFNVANWSGVVLASMLNSVVIPSFSRIKDQHADLPGALARATSTVALIAAPIGSLTLALSFPLITTVYGTKWSEAAPILSVLSVYGVINVICLLFANVVTAMGRSGVLLGVQIAALMALVPALFVGIIVFGVVGAGVAHIAVICLVTLPAYLIAVRRSTATGLVVLLGAVLPPLAAGVVCGVAAWAMALLPANAIYKLAAGGVTGVLVYAVLMTNGFVALLPVRLARWEPVQACVKGRNFVVALVTRCLGCSGQLTASRQCLFPSWQVSWQRTRSRSPISREGTVALRRVKPPEEMTRTTTS